MNKIIIKGRLGRDPEIKYSKDLAIATVSVAVNKPGKDAGADWFSVTAFGKQAELLEKWWHKGDEIIVVGRMQSNKYTDRNGVEKTTWSVIASELEFCGKKETAKPEPKKEAPRDADGFVTVDDPLDDDGLPFV